MELAIRVAGEAGQGVLSAGNLLVGALAKLGLYVFTVKSYMSRIRGGLNWFDIRIADRPLYAGTERADLLVALTDAALDVLHDEVNDGGMILYDSEEADDDDGVITVAFTKAAGTIAQKIMANTVAAGAVFEVLGYDCDELCDYLKEQFADKGEEVVDANLRCARQGGELARLHTGALKGPLPGRAAHEVIAGAQAVGLGAATAGVKFAVAYPMTPGTATLNALASLAGKYNIVVEQAEDEISAINMLCGATYAGVPSITVTSGGGFALMVEGLSLAGIMELPAVILIAQRPGPATGLPTRTAQGELKFALSAGHGEFPRAVYAPGSQAQCYCLTRKALAVAHRYQTPVIILTDQFLQDAEKNGRPPSDKACPIDRALALDAGEDYQRYAVTDSGISPRAIPGGEAFVVLDSDEHTADGHVTEDLDAHMAQHDKRMRKADGLTAEALAPSRLGADTPETMLICWGSTYGACREAVETLNADGGNVAMLHFSQVWPINAENARARLGTPKRVVVVEGNSTGQFAGVLRECGVIGEAELLTRYDGLPFTAEYIIKKLGGTK